MAKTAKQLLIAEQNKARAECEAAIRGQKQKASQLRTAIVLERKRSLLRRAAASPGYALWLRHKGLRQTPGTAALYFAVYVLAA